MIEGRGGLEFELGETVTNGQHAGLLKGSGCLERF